MVTWFELFPLQRYADLPGYTCNSVLILLVEEGMGSWPDFYTCWSERRILM